jgi:hypothetical protein
MILGSESRKAAFAIAGVSSSSEEEEDEEEDEEEEDDESCSFTIVTGRETMAARSTISFTVRSGASRKQRGCFHGVLPSGETLNNRKFAPTSTDAPLSTVRRGNIWAHTHRSQALALPYFPDLQYPAARCINNKINGGLKMVRRQTRIVQSVLGRKAPPVSNQIATHTAHLGTLSTYGTQGSYEHQRGELFEEPRQ